MYNKTIDEFTSVLASNSPTPGGGGASALVGSIAICLGSMVGSLTIGKKKYAQFEDELNDLQIKAEALRVKLLDGINDDAKAFEPLAKAYGIPKDDPTRAEQLEQCLKLAADGPFGILKDICSAIELINRYGQIGSKLAISDAATGAMIGYGALYGAAINVKANTKLMKDKDYANKLNQKVDELVDRYGQLALETYQNIERDMH